MKVTQKYVTHVGLALSLDQAGSYAGPFANLPRSLGAQARLYGI